VKSLAALGPRQYSSARTASSIIVFVLRWLLKRTTSSKEEVVRDKETVISPDDAVCLYFSSSFSL
jgi:hypothetical protein